jgi:hypothetical protein
MRKREHSLADQDQRIPYIEYRSFDMERRDRVDKDRDKRATSFSFLLTDRIDDATARKEVEYASRSVNISPIA